jgi:CHAD domain-containing protein
VSVEREVKLGAWPGFVLPDLTGACEGLTADAPRSLRLTTTYHDAADLRLVRSRLSLRHRDGEGGAGGRWTLKLPPPPDTDSGEVGLTRTEIVVDGGPAAVPEELVRLVRAVLRGAPLQPVATLRTTRVVVPLAHDGVEVAQVCDDEVSVLEGEHVAARFRELEVEASPGVGPDEVGPIMESVVARLRAAGAGEPDPTSKIARALGPRALVPADPLVPLVEQGQPAAVTVRAAMAASVRRLLGFWPHLALDPGVHVVHQARVAARRLRSDLRTFGPLFEPGFVDPLVGELRWLAGLLGEVRDLDVQRLRLRDLAAGLHEADGVAGRGGEGLVDRLAPRRADRAGALAEATTSLRAEALATALVAAAMAPAFVARAQEPAEEVLRELVREPWTKLARAARRADRDSPDDELHALRIRAKRARYAAEAAARAVPGAARHAKAIAALQDELGELHDAVVTEAWLRRQVAEGADPAEAFAAGLLVAADRARARSLRRAWPEVWERAERRKLRSWLEAD